MRKFTMTLAATALVLGSMAIAANAQSQSAGAASVHGLVQNATPIVKSVACRGYGRWCGPGWVRACGRWGCRCVPCY
jgi:hypothetical protein